MRQKIVGVYKITNTVNGMIYIGSSIDTKNRWWQHRKELRSGKHHNDKFKKAFKKYGEDAFVFEVVEVCTIDHLRDREQAWILETRCAERAIGYNLTTCVDSPNRGKKMSPEACARMSKAKKGVKKPPFTEEHKAAIAASWELRRLVPVSEETRKKQSEARVGKPRPASFVEKMTGRRNTPETIERMKASSRRAVAEGRVRPPEGSGGKLSPESEAKRVASLKATMAHKRANPELYPSRAPVTEETRARMREGQARVVRKPHSEETKAKMRASALARLK